MPWDQVCMQVTQNSKSFILFNIIIFVFWALVWPSTKRNIIKCDAIFQMGGGFGLINTDEDCLHLSVHVPVQQGGDGPLAVMVWTIIIIKLSLKSWAPPTHNHHHHCSGVVDRWCFYNGRRKLVWSWLLDDTQHHTGHSLAELWSYDYLWFGPVT